MVPDIPKKVQYAIARERYLSLENESSVLDEYLSKDVDDDSPASKAGIKEGDIISQVNGKDVSAKERQWRDTYQVPYWTGTGRYPSIKVRMDFRGAVAGDFVYHCHILDHEDRGMMAIIRVKPKA